MGQNLSSQLEPLVEADHVDALDKQLAKNNLDYNCHIDDLENSILHLAVNKGSVAIVTFLLDQGADVNAQNKLGCTPLQNAVFAGSVSIVELLLKFGADVNLNDKSGMTALHWAVMEKRFDLVESLVNHGARLQQEDDRGKTPLSLTTSLGKRSGVRMRQQLVECAKRRDEASSLVNLRLADVCRIWAAIQYTHPTAAYRFQDISTLDAVLAHCVQRLCDEPQSFRNVCTALLSSVGDASTRIIDLNDVSDNLMSQSSNEIQPTLQLTQDGIAVIRMTLHSQFAQFSKLDLFYKVFQEAFNNSDAVVFDLRNHDVMPDQATDQLPSDNNSNESYTFKYMFIEAFRMFLKSDLILPAQRQRVYRGLPEHLRGAQSTFTHGLFTSDAGVVPMLERDQPQKTTSSDDTHPYMVFVVNRRTPGSLVDVAVAAQSASLARIVYEHDAVSARAGGVLFADEPLSIVHTLAARATLPPDTDDRPVPPFVAVVRRAERVAACGSLGVQPDAVVTPAPPPGVKSTLNGVHEHGATATTSNGAGVTRTLVSGADSPAYGAALGLLRGSTLPTRTPSTLASAHSRQQRTTDPCEGRLPTLPYRCVAIARLWHALRWFHANSSMVADWERLLVETLPVARRASTPLSYARCILGLTSKLHDSAATVRCAALAEARGSHAPPLLLRTLPHGQTVVARVWADAGEADRHALSECVGSVLLRVAGVPIAEARRRAVSLVAGAANDTALDSRSNLLILSGPINSTVEIQLRSPSGKISTQTLRRTHPLRRVALCEATASDATGVRRALPPLALLDAPQHTGEATGHAKSSKTEPQHMSKENDDDNDDDDNDDVAPTSHGALVAQALTAAARQSVSDNSGIAYCDAQRVTAQDLLSERRVLQSACALIVDLRAGARPGVAERLSSVVSDQQRVSVSGSTTRMVFGFDCTDTEKFEPLRASAPRWLDSSEKETSHASFPDGVFVLIDETTTPSGERCAADLLAARADVRLIGQATPGAAGKTTNLLLPGGIALEFTVAAATLNDNVVLGSLVPDHVVPLQIQSLINGVDETFDTALSMCRARRTQRAQSTSKSTEA